jgi:hypothetical protein
MVGTFYNPNELTKDELIAKKTQLESTVDIYFDSGKVSKANQVKNIIKVIVDEINKRDGLHTT